MEKLAICCKILYDRDILDKHDQLIQYKQNMIQPILYFESREIYTHKKKVMQEDLLNKINIWYSDEEFLDYSIGINSDTYFQNLLYSHIYSALVNFFNTSDWLCTLVYHMCIGFETIIPNYIKENNWRMQWISIPNIIYTSIQEQLDIIVFVNHHNKFFRFKCHNCQHIYKPYDMKHNICRDCIVNMEEMDE